MKIFIYCSILLYAFIHFNSSYAGEAAPEASGVTKAPFMPTTVGATGTGADNAVGTTLSSDQSHPQTLFSIREVMTNISSYLDNRSMPAFTMCNRGM